MQSQVRGDLLSPEPQLCWKEGWDSMEGTRDSSGWGGSVHTPFAHPQPEAREPGVGGFRAGSTVPGALGVALTPFLGLSVSICEKRPLGPP